MTTKNFDIIVVGAGPAGATFTIALQNSGYSIALIDQAKFPRDKVCGDAIPGRAVRVLERLSPDIAQRFAAFSQKQRIRGGKAVGSNGAKLQIFYQGIGYTSARSAFDHFLFQEACKNPAVTIFDGSRVTHIQHIDNGVAVELAEQPIRLQAKLIIGCDGANSVVARQLGQRKIDLNHHCGAVRAYFEGIQMDHEDILEVFLLKKCLPGYFWVFPLQDGRYNVGFGMLSKDISQKGINLRRSFQEIIQEAPQLQTYFQNARQLGDIKGFGLPLGSRKVPISGAHFLLCGDAASLVDPATGEGIGNAMLSAYWAAQQAKESLDYQDFSAIFLGAYDKLIRKKLGRELQTKYRLQQVLKNRSWLINFLLHQAQNNPIVKRIAKKVI